MWVCVCVLRLLLVNLASARAVYVSPLLICRRHPHTFTANEETNYFYFLLVCVYMCVYMWWMGKRALWLLWKPQSQDGNRFYGPLHFTSFVDVYFSLSVCVCMCVWVVFIVLNILLARHSITMSNGQTQHKKGEQMCECVCGLVMLSIRVVSVRAQRFALNFICARLSFQQRRTSIFVFFVFSSLCSSHLPHIKLKLAVHFSALAVTWKEDVAKRWKTIEGCARDVLGCAKRAHVLSHQRERRR